MPAPFNFSGQPPGTAYAIRVRATDAADGARWLEKPFTVTLAAPHAPTAVVPEATSLSGGLIVGQSAGLLFATDLDAFDRHAFTLVAGAGADHNAYFTVVGAELRLATILPAGLTASVTTTPQPVLITAATVLKARALSGGEWSAVNEASFFLAGTQPATTANLTVSEIHYHPEGDGLGDAEFIEFANTGANSVDMTGVKLGGAVIFTFPSGMVLLPGLRVAGVWSGSLSNSGEELTALAANNAPICSFAYDDAGAWPGRADGNGSSLELANPASAAITLAAKNAFPASPTNWRPSAEFHGSPGYAGSGPDHRVVINEVFSASIPPDVDFIELLNPGGTSQSIGGWFLSDSSDDYRKFKIPAGMSLASGAYLVLNESHFNTPANPGCLVPFALSSSGDDVYLLQADSAGNLLKFIDRVEFGS
ncbi:MAG: hypothetical protein RLZZ522_918, partial [Verrucomicrobiota bacterium]